MWVSKIVSGLIVVVLLLVWQLAVSSGYLSAFQFPPPSRIGEAIVELINTGFPNNEHIWTHIGVTLWRIIQGYVLAIGLAIPIGLLIGAVAVLDKLTLPVITFGRSVATLSLLPLVIIWFGTGELTKVLLIAYGCFWAMLSNVIAGVKYVDPTLLRAARTLDTSRLAMFTRVVVPAALPRMFAGARMALGVGFMVIVGAEMIGTIQGLGALIMEARTFYRSDITIVGMLFIGLLGFTIASGLSWLETVLLPWNKGLDEVRR